MIPELLLKHRNKSILLFTILLLAKTLVMTIIDVFLLASGIFSQNPEGSRLQLIASCVTILLGIFIFYCYTTYYFNKVVEADVNSEVGSKQVNAYSFKCAIVLTIITLIQTCETVAILYVYGVLTDLLQVLFFYSIGHFVSLLTGCFFYYIIKIRSFAASKTFRITPISTTVKLLVPLSSTIIGVLIVAVIFSYNARLTSTFDAYASEMSHGLSEQNVKIENMLSLVKAELKGYAIVPAIQTQDFARIPAYLRSIHGNKGEVIETVFFINRQGVSYSSIGHIDDFSTQQFFKQAIESNSDYVSSPFFNIRTGVKVLMLCTPVMLENGVKGLMAATIPTINLNTLNKEITNTQNFMLVDETGKIMVHSDVSFVDMTIAKSPLLTSDGITTVNIEKILTEPEGSAFEYAINGSNMMAIKAKNQTLNWSYVFSETHSLIVSKLRGDTINLLILMHVLSLITFILTIRITSKVSKTVNLVVDAVNMLTNGQFAAETSEITPDEMGLLVKTVGEFSEKLKIIISKASETAIMLESSSEELADASRNLSDGSQSRAASVEEATAAIEEVSSSVEQISTSAEKQAKLASVTYTAMEQLKEDIGTVLNRTVEALETANKTTRQAQNGNKIMLDTITSMDSIDTSTKKIAEMILMVSSISDQVNLLALNASIEAARAGEHGKGFAIVAEEISKLADETASAAKNISELVNTGLKEVAKGRKYVNSTKSAFDEIIGFIEATGDLMNSITKSAQQQFDASENVLTNTKNVMEMAETINIATNEQMITNQEMSRTIEQINQGTLSEAARSEEIAFSASEINAQAVALSNEIKFFKL